MNIGKGGAGSAGAPGGSGGAGGTYTTRGTYTTIKGSGRNDGSEVSQNTGYGGKGGSTTVNGNQALALGGIYPGKGAVGSPRGGRWTGGGAALGINGGNGQNGADGAVIINYY